MRTILYNTLTQKPVSGILDEGYNLQLEEGILELEVVDTPKPELAVNEIATPHYEHKEGKWVRVWDIEVITWLHSHPIRIEAKEGMLGVPEAPAMFTKLSIRGLPIEEVEGEEGTTYHIYINEIKAEEGYLLAKYPELLTVVYRDEN